MAERTWGITGHTGGIGRAISAMLIARGDRVVGFSRSTGHDLALPGMVERVVALAAGLDGFVAVAHQGFAQVALLEMLYDLRGQDPGFAMVTIGSNATDWLLGSDHRYATAKAALERSARALSHAGRWRLTHLRLGWVDTPRSRHRDVGKLAPDDVAHALSWVLDRPGHVRVPEITLRPA